MSRTTCRLAIALVLSLLLHISPFTADFIHLPPPAARTAQPMRAELRAAMPPPPPLALNRPETASRSPKKNERVATATTASNNHWQQEVRKQFKKQQESGQFYPAEAIAQGLEGEALVLMLHDENGQVAAARIEQGSGQPILDGGAGATLATRRCTTRGIVAGALQTSLISCRYPTKNAVSRRIRYIIHENISFRR